VLLRANATVFEDPKSHALLSRIRRVAPSNATVLITGETGTGKEIVARHIHELSDRAKRPFVAVNCGAFSQSLIESDLFGHEKGAFTGAVTGTAGWFEAANGGTLFLDEIGDLPLGAQVKLLRVLQERQVVRLGSRNPVPVDVRLIASTNVQLEQAVTAGHFREDLFYRLAVVRIMVDALRERPGDILPLARHFIDTYAVKSEDPAQASIPELSPAAESCLLSHPWLGNVRELENAIHHALLVCQGDVIEPEDLPHVTTLPRRSTPHVTPLPTMATKSSVPPWPVATAGGRADARVTLRSALWELYGERPSDLWNELEETIMLTAYEYSNGNQLQTARLLGISRNVVRARLLRAGVLFGGTRDANADAPEEEVGTGRRLRTVSAA
jgi:sigma-54 dependent transcriptional regulator